MRNRLDARDQIADFLRRQSQKGLISTLQLRLPSAQGLLFSCCERGGDGGALFQSDDSVKPVIIPNQNVNPAFLLQGLQIALSFTIPSPPVARPHARALTVNGRMELCCVIHLGTNGQIVHDLFVFALQNLERPGGSN